MDSDNYSLVDFIEYNDPDIFKKAHFFYEYAEDYIAKKYFTYFRTLLTSCNPEVTILDRYTGKKKKMIMLASNNYLGLSSHPEVIKAGQEALGQYGPGLGGSPLLCGYSALHRELEEKLAAYKSCEDAMVFPTGFSTNIGVITALLRKDDVVISDRFNHASIIDGALFSGAQFRSFGHNNTNKLESILKNTRDKGKLVVVEGVYSMDGDLSLLDKIKNLTDVYNARLMVDEAHATGILGKRGRGTIEYFDLEGKIDIVMGTFSKTLGAMGGFICSTKEVINYLRFYSRSYFFSASLSPVIAACVSKAIDILEKEPQLRENLWKNINYMKENLTSLGFNIGQSHSAIIPIHVGEEITLRKMATEIHEKEIFLNSVFYPAVPQGQARIRLSLMSTLTKSCLDKALDVLEEVGKKHHII
ncbi:MAG: aminotransferase class I/II-fold pyridoxal phosphate-dependent enzyme [Spirochaetales bacterium]|nr:aminotransferase class I/II-fold pyridoxal phosphate-dependent enzyme [Spirochaetales bacterium]